MAPGVTPGSAPGHLALFGYDPLEWLIGRGVLEATGIDLELSKGDVAVRGNFCSMDESGTITDRRAGRISTEESARLCQQLDGQNIDDVQVRVYPVKEHRFVAVFSGEGLSAGVSDSDPQQEGVPPHDVVATRPEAQKMADSANRFIAEARQILGQNRTANMLLLRGFSQKPDIPSTSDVYRLHAAAVAAYPMYRGLARLVGMQPLDAGSSVGDAFSALERHVDDYEFFFLHVKRTDSAGEDGDFGAKVAAIEEADAHIPQLTRLKLDAIVVTGDHSTPAKLRGHSWHPVPCLLWSDVCRPDAASHFSEPECLSGGLGRIKGTDVMPLAMANALKLEKFGA